MPSMLPIDLLKFLSDKGAFTATLLTALAAILSITLKSSSSLIETLVRLMMEVTNKQKRVQEVRGANLLLRVAQRHETSQEHQILRNRQRHAARRLSEVQALYKRQKRAAGWATFVNGLLTAAQYLVGATLASSFIQKSLSPNLTGTLGVLVVIASTVQQKYTPDVIATAAKARVVLLKRIILRAEDSLVEADRRGDGTDFQKISNMLSAAIVSADMFVPNSEIEPKGAESSITEATG